MVLSITTTPQPCPASSGYLSSNLRRWTRDRSCLRSLPAWPEDLDRALLLIDRALELDENLAPAWQRRGWVGGYAGDSESAIASLQRAIRLNPLDPRVFLTQSAMGFAHFIAGRDEEAAEWAAKALRVKPRWPPALREALVANALCGRAGEVERVRTTYLDIDPEREAPR